jgi:Zn-dependent peptidase ImmA (M78 family)
LRFDEIEIDANQFWTEHQLHIPVDVWAVCETLGIDIERRRLPASVEGMYIITPGHAPIIAINETRSLTVRRLTVLHEIRHDRRGDGEGKSGTICQLRTPRNQSPVELECDRWAYCVLMPHWLVYQYYGELSHNKEWMIRIMAERFEVEESAVKHRLESLNLLDEVKA